MEISQYETQEESVKWNIHLSEMAGKCHRMYLLIILVESAGDSKGVFSLRTCNASDRTRTGLDFESWNQTKSNQSVHMWTSDGGAVPVLQTVSAPSHSTKLWLVFQCSISELAFNNIDGYWSCRTLLSTKTQTEMKAGLWNAEKHLCPAVGFLLAGGRTHNSPLIYIQDSGRNVFKLTLLQK